MVGCTSRSPRHATEPAYDVPPPDPRSPAGDADRERTAALLTEATGAGYLTLCELDQRLVSVWCASTAAQLAAVESDIPADLRGARDRREAAARARDVARAGLAPRVASYARVMVLLVAVWAAVGVMGGGWYPWPLWPALGWGLGLAGHVRAARGANLAPGDAALRR